jgi:hypothetical protein
MRQAAMNMTFPTISPAMPPPLPAVFGAEQREVPATSVATSNRRHREMFCIALCVIALSIALRVDGDRVSLWCLKTHPIPQLCGARALFGINCPVCGLTRSFIHLAHGRWQAANHCHRLGWVMALMTVMQIPYRLWCLQRGPLFSDSQTRWISRALIVGLLLNWLLQAAP